jgi:HD-like signal output (HDOD) protein
MTSRETLLRSLHYPDVVIRLRQLLDGEQSTTDQLVQLLATEPALAAKLTQMANSVALRRSR